MVWQPRIKRDAGSKFMGVVEAIEEDVAAGLLAEGERMPPQRSVAAALGIDLTTVTRAYTEARLRGILTAGAGRSGTRVADGAEGASRRALAYPVDLSLNIPPQPARADLAARMGRTVAEILSGGAALLQYGPAAGSDTDRMAGAAWLRTVVGPVPETRIVVTSGAQAAIFAAFSAHLGPGDRIGMGEVTYPGARAAAARAGAEPVPLRMDGEGVTPEAVESACRGSGLRALYLVPTIDNPTTATMGKDRRRAILAVAERYGLVLVEDDPYRRLAEDAPPAFASLAPDLTCHVATLAKCATPGLRIAYVAAPSERAATGIGAVLRGTTLMAPPLMAAVATRWMADGTLARIVDAVREESAARQAAAARVLRDVDHRADPRGHHLWLPLPAGWSGEDFAGRAARSGVAVVPGREFAVGPEAPEAVRVSLGAARDRTALTAGLRRLADLLSAGPGRRYVLV